MNSFIPFVTKYESTKLCSGDIGPETSEMGIHDIVGVPDRALSSIFDRLDWWFREVKYIGWFGASCIYDPEKDKLSVFEFMTRLGSSSTEDLLSMLGVSFDEFLSKLIDGRYGSDARPHYPDFRYKHAQTVVIVGQGHPLRDVYSRQRITTKGASIHAFMSGVYLDSGVNVDMFCRLYRGETIALADRHLYTEGPSGRALFATGAGDTFEEARLASLTMASSVSFKGCFYRNDIGNVYSRCYTQLFDAGLIPVFGKK
jgi:phosphoribosylamine-glycine ligase